MNEFETKLKQFISQNQIPAEHLTFQQSCHSVAEAAEAAGVTSEDFVKNICMFDSNDNLIVAIVKGEDRVSPKEVARHVGSTHARTATPEEMLARTGYPCGGTPSFGYSARFLIDPRVLEQEVVYSGGGSENSLVKMSSKALLEANRGEIVKIRK
jgi:prolyl-tRNA editing enzyme YbaK/EbsC (Cys-tRNA(Pro) deacylase)